MHERVVDGTRACRAHDGCGEHHGRYLRMRTRAGVAHVGVCEGADGTGMVWMRVRARGHAYVTSGVRARAGAGAQMTPGWATCTRLTPSPCSGRTSPPGAFDALPLA